MCYSLEEWLEHYTYQTNVNCLCGYSFLQLAINDHMYLFQSIFIYK